MQCIVKVKTTEVVTDGECKGEGGQRWARVFSLELDLWVVWVVFY